MRIAVAVLVVGNIVLVFGLTRGDLRPVFGVPFGEGDTGGGDPTSDELSEALESLARTEIGVPLTAGAFTDRLETPSGERNDGDPRPGTTANADPGPAGTAPGSSTAGSSSDATESSSGAGSDDASTGSGSDDPSTGSTGSGDDDSTGSEGDSPGDSTGGGPGGGDPGGGDPGGGGGGGG